MIKEILLLGNPALYEISEAVREEELTEMAALERDLHDTMMEFRRIYKAGRGHRGAADRSEKTGALYERGEPVLLINPVLEFPDGEMMEVMDDCMSFPGLLVKVDRYRRCRIHYKDRNWQDEEMELEGDLSELLQHEYDHLTEFWRSMRPRTAGRFIGRWGETWDNYLLISCKL